MSGTRFLAEHLDQVVRYAAMAPSLHNSQPWRFRQVGPVLELRVDRERHLPATDPDGRQLLVSCGAALLGARLAVRARGHAETVALLPDPHDPDLLARMSVSGRAHPSRRDLRLHAALPLRRTARAGFRADPVDRSLLVEAQLAAAEEGGLLYLLEHEGHRRAVAEVVAAADRAHRAHPGARAELRAWTPGAGAGRRDGVPPQHYPPTPVPGVLPVRDFDDGRGLGTLQVVPEHAGPAPAAAVLLTPSDTRRDWLVAGAALHAALLTAATEGVSASLHSQPIGLSGLRTLLADEVAWRGTPQMLLQLGYAVPVPATPRRPPADVIDLTARTPATTRTT